MSFERAGIFIFDAAKKYNLHKQAASGIVLETTRTIFRKKYPLYATIWCPKKFEAGKLTIETTNASASSALFMKTHEIIEAINKIDIPQKVISISIRKINPRVDSNE